MRTMFFLLLALALIAGVVYVAVFEQQWLENLFKQGVREARGFTPAKTPEEALGKFRDAIKERDYEMAALYCGGDYAGQVKKAAPVARELAVAIDSLELSIPKDLSSDPVTYVLRRLEPMPRHFGFGEIKREGDERGMVKVYEEPPLKPPLAGMSHGAWDTDPLIFRALVSDWTPQTVVELKREGQGDAASWKVHVAVSDKLRNSVDRLVEKHAAYVKAVQNVEKQVKDGSFTKAADLELALKKALEGAK